jgi:hypothetical protein
LFNASNSESLEKGEFAEDNSTCERIQSPASGAIGIFF